MDTPEIPEIEVIPYTENEAEGGRDLLVAIGRVTSAFQAIEYALCEIYLTFFPKNAQDSATVAYHAVRMIEGRQTVVGALIKHFCEQSTLEEWNQLIKCIRARAEIRNAAAHGLACTIGKAPNRKWGIAPSPYDIANFTGSLKLNEYYTAKELEEAANATLELTKRLNGFVNALSNNSRLRVKLAAHQKVAQSSVQTPMIIQLPPVKS